MFIGFDCMVLCMLVINLVFVGGLFVGFFGSVYEVFSICGDWMF